MPGPIATRTRGMRAACMVGWARANRHGNKGLPLYVGGSLRAGTWSGLRCRFWLSRQLHLGRQCRCHPGQQAPGPGSYAICVAMAMPWFGIGQAPGSDAICVVWNRIGPGGKGVGFGSVCLGLGSGSVRFLQARFGFGSDLPAQVRNRLGFCTQNQAHAHADAMAVEVQSFSNNCLMKTTGLHSAT